MIVWAAILAVVLAFGISALATPLSRRLAFRLGFIDIPQRHKVHSRPTPLLGGSVIFIAILAPSLLAMAIARIWSVDGVPEWILVHLPELARHVAGAAAKSNQAMGILAAAAGMHVLGLVDDKRHLGPWSKLLVQTLLVSAVVIFCDVRILTMFTAGGGALSIGLSIIWLLAITNAFNFLDNMDGLAVGVAAICAATLLAASASLGQIFVSAWLCLILGALLGYWPYNFPRASTFMGDGGSLVIGFLLGVVSCLTTYVGPSSQIGHYAVLVPLVLMAVPLYDTMSVLWLRIRDRQNPMVGDHRHFSHRLVRRGMSVRTAVLTIYLCTAGTAIAAALLPRVDLTGSILVFAQTAGTLMIIALLESGDSKL